MVSLSPEPSIPSSPPSSSSTSLSVASSRFGCGFTSGLLQAGLFNWWDRALYLSVANDRPFLHRKNFKAPWTGILQSITQRAASAGCYFPLEDLFKQLIFEADVISVSSHAWGMFYAGSFAGSVNGLVMNPVTRVKYQYWSAAGKGGRDFRNFFTTAMYMFRTGGLRPFFLGSAATIGRDLIFGSIFSSLRFILNKKTEQQYSLTCNLVSGCLATLLSSPLNYVRNVHYASSPNQSRVAGVVIIRNLLLETSKQDSVYQGLSFLQQRLRIGWGTLRVGVGMAVGARIYEICKSQTNHCWLAVVHAHNSIHPPDEYKLPTVYDILSDDGTVLGIMSYDINITTVVVSMCYVEVEVCT